MSSPFGVKVLAVNASQMPKIDPQNLESIFGMWMIFSKCAESVEEGKRLENLGLRLWNREIIYRQSRQDLATTHAHTRPPSLSKVPSLSASVDSAASAAFGDPKHITSKGLEKMVLKIMETTELKPLALNVATSPREIADPASGCPWSQLRIEKRDAFPPEPDPPTVIVRGFSSPRGRASSGSKSEPSQGLTAPSQLQQMSQHEAPKKGDMFMLSGSIGPDKGLFKNGISCQPKPSSSFKANQLEKSKKPLFEEIVQSIEGADPEDESAIEAAWEDYDSESESGNLTFSRGESNGHLIAQRSMLTMLLHKPRSAAAMVHQASRGSPWLRRSRTSSCGSPAPGLSNGNKNVCDTQSGTHPPVNSPRTTRRNMLAAELTQSLRKHLVWANKAKSTTANAVLKRRETTPILNSPNCCAQQTDTKTILLARCPLADVPGSACEAPPSCHDHPADVCTPLSATKTRPHNTDEDLNLEFWTSDYNWLGW